LPLDEEAKAFGVVGNPLGPPSPANGFNHFPGELGRPRVAVARGCVGRNSLTGTILHDSLLQIRAAVRTAYATHRVMGTIASMGRRTGSAGFFASCPVGVKTSLGAYIISCPQKESKRRARK
jgi:hypothetical protein